MTTAAFDRMRGRGRWRWLHEGVEGGGYGRVLPRCCRLYLGSAVGSAVGYMRGWRVEDTAGRSLGAEVLLGPVVAWTGPVWAGVTRYDLLNAHDF